MTPSTGYGPPPLVAPVPVGSPVTPAGAENRTSVADVRVTVTWADRVGHGIDGSYACRAVSAAGNSGHACVNVHETHAEVSLATIPWAGICWDAPGMDVPAGTTIIPTDPSPATRARHVHARGAITCMMPWVSEKAANDAT